MCVCREGWRYTMLITRIELENIKSYRHMTIDLQRGTTAISGANGAGKTTLVEAIGFALFGYLPYSQDKFVREGEKGGKIVINLIGNDMRPYVVERRCGANARWLVFDEEADMRLEQRADVSDKLHDLFGIERERPLDALFRDALGVPQGTFTAIFLETPAKRKQTFDALLQIEDYRTAADNLLETQHYYKEQMQEQQLVIERLSFATKDIEEWRAQLAEGRERHAFQQRGLEQQSKQLTELETHRNRLDEQARALKELEHRYHSAQESSKHEQLILQERATQRRLAYEAQQIVINSSDDYHSHVQTQESIKALRQDALKRDQLRQQQHEQKRRQAQTDEKISGWQTRLDEVALAQQKETVLLPLVEQQEKLERNFEEANQQAMRYDQIVEDGKRQREQRDRAQQERDHYQGKIEEVKQLIPLADLLEERVNALTELRVQGKERGNKQNRLQEARKALQEKRTRLQTSQEQVQRYDLRVKQVEAHRHEGEQLPHIQQQYEQLQAQVHRLEGNIDGYIRSRKQTANGQCPFLNEDCLNIRKHGVVNLDTYFDELLAQDHAQLVSLQEQRNITERQVQQWKPYADEIGKVEQYREQLEHATQNTQLLQQEIGDLEEEATRLNNDMLALKTIEQQINQASSAYTESKNADARVRESIGWHEQVTQRTMQIAQLESELNNLRQELDKFKDGKKVARQIKEELAGLQDPRRQLGIQQSIASHQQEYQQRMQTELMNMQGIDLKLSELEELLRVYQNLDREIAEQEQSLLRSAHGYQNYLQHERTAQALPEREQAYQQQVTVAREAEERLQALEQEYRQASAIFDPGELQQLKEWIETLNRELATLLREIQYQQEHVQTLESDIARGEELLQELGQAQQEEQTLEDLHTMTEQFRKLIKEAAPHVLKAMLADISAEANRIFGEIIGDRSALLSWRNDYEIILRRQSVERSFAQLSGGEQMSAALSVRLALLKKLSTLNIAFFDEPTQNMDETRRMNLAAQIRRVRGFDQLIIISHDDTFEQGLDSLVRLRKMNSETHLLGDEEVEAQQEKEQAWQEEQIALLPTRF